MMPSFPSSARSLRWIGTVGALILGVVFLVAAGAKAIDPEAFAEQIRLEGLDVLLPAFSVALVAIALEVGLGLALLLDLRRTVVLGVTALLVVFFLFLTGRSYWRSLQGVELAESCGCFGNLVERSPAEAFWQDLFLLGVPLGLAFVGRPGARRVGPRAGVAVVGAAAAALLAWRAPELPLDDLATSLKPGTEVASICAGAEDTADRICLDALASELEEGEHVVVLAELDDAFGSRVPELEALQEELDGGLWVLTAATPEEHQTFYWSWGPTFEILEAPPALLRPLYRRLPRSFLVVEGVVQKTWSGLPELS